MDDLCLLYGFFGKEMRSMDVIEILKAVILGIAEGITEWLPISSTGHMILLDQLIHLKVSEEFMNLFLVVIQLGAILAVILCFFKKLWPFTTKEKGYVKKDTMLLWAKVVVGVIPLGVVGVLFEDAIDAVFYNYQTVAFTLILYGIFFILIEKYNKKRKPVMTNLKELTFSMAIGIGMFQVLSVIPGTSRSGATILGAMLLGCGRSLAAEYSFFLSIPVMFGASLLKVLKFEGAVTGSEIGLLLIGMVVAFVVSVIAIKFLMGYIKKKDFTVFGWYRIVLGAIIVLCALFVF